MKRALIAIVGIVAAFLITRDLTTATDIADRATDQSAAIDLYESRHGTLDTTAERHGYLDNAYQACVYLDTNPSLPELWLAMTNSGISSDAAATTIEAGILYLCLVTGIC